MKGSALRFISQLMLGFFEDEFLFLSFFFLNLFFLKLELKDPSQPHPEILEIDAIEIMKIV